MNEYPLEHMPAEPEPDPRVIAMQRVVELEQASYHAASSAKQAAERADVTRARLSEARDELHKMLGVTAGERASAGGVLQ